MGIILFNSEKELLVIQRRNTMAFIDIIRGRLPAFYNMNFNDKLKILLREITYSERTMLLNDTFEELWEFLWGESKYRRRREFSFAKKKFYSTRNIIKDILDDKIYGNYLCPEFSFPKGRRNAGESLKNCAIREFEEESGYSKDDYQLIKDDIVFEELYMGTNGVEYKHVYYLAKVVTEDPPRLDTKSSEEVASVGFYDRKTLYTLFRSYEESKVTLIDNIYSHLFSKNFYK